MIDPNLYFMWMAQGGYINDIYTELRVYENEFGFQVYMLEPKIELMATFEQLDWAEEFAINYFN